MPEFEFVYISCLFFRSFPSLWLFVGQLVSSRRLMDHLLGVSPGELPPAPVSLWLTRLPVTTPLHCGLHGCIQPVDRCLYLYLGPCGLAYHGRVWTPRCSLGGGSWLSSNRLGLGICIWSKRASAYFGSCAVWCERDMRSRLWEVTISRECTHVCTFLPHSFLHPRLSATGRCWGVWVFTFLSSLTPASTILSTTIFPRVPFVTHYDEHPMPTYSHRFIHSPLLGVTKRRVWGPVGLCYDQTCCLANIH